MSKATTRPCVKCGRNRSERFFTSARGRTCTACRKRSTARQARAVRLLQTYGLSAADYAAILAYQDGKCAICKGTRRRHLDTDHDHVTGIVRGLCCARCNRHLLRSARDSVDILSAAIEYLIDPPAPRALGRTVVVPGGES